MSIRWISPWRPVSGPEEAADLEIRLFAQLTAVHPLWGEDVRVIGRAKVWDILLALPNDRFAAVHLLGRDGPDRLPEQYPWTTIYASAAEAEAEFEEDLLYEPEPEHTNDN